MKSIRQKLVIYTLLLVVLPFLFSNIASSYYMNLNYEKELEENNKGLANSLADQVASFIEKGYSMTEQITLNSVMQKQTAQHMAQLII